MSVTQEFDFSGPGRDHGIRSHDTERASAAEGRTSLRERVLAAYKAAGRFGLTDYETGIRIGCRPHSAGTRRKELTDRFGVNIVDSGRRRPTDSNRQAIIWFLEDSE